MGHATVSFSLDSPSQRAKLQFPPLFHISATFTLLSLSWPTIPDRGCHSANYLRTEESCISYSQFCYLTASAGLGFLQVGLQILAATSRRFYAHRMCRV